VRSGECLAQAEALIPAEYRLVAGTGFQSLALPVEGFWQVLGKIYLLKGHNVIAPIEADRPLDEHQEKLLLDGVEHYALAMAYFLKYSERLELHEGTLKTIYGSLKRCGLARLEKAVERVKVVAELYQVDLSPLLNEIGRPARLMGFLPLKCRLFEDTGGLS